MRLASPVPHPEARNTPQLIWLVIGWLPGELPTFNGLALPSVRNCGCARPANLGPLALPLLPEHFDAKVDELAAYHRVCAVQITHGGCPNPPKPPARITSS